MTAYFGRPGSLVAFRSPHKGIPVKMTRQSRLKETLAGGRAADYSPGVLREWVLSWSALSHDDQSTLTAYFAGHNGPGPWAFIDGAERNLLTRNQSSATSTFNDTSGFTAAGAGEGLASSSTVFERGPRGLAWSLPASVTGGVLRLDGPRSDWYGIPCVPGQTYRYQYRIKASGTDTAVDGTPQLRWVDAAGAQVSVSAGTLVTSSTSWQSAFVSATCPAGAVYAQPQTTVAAASVTATSTLHLDYFMASMPTTRDPGTVWVAGLGVPRVTVPTLDHVLMWINFHSAGLTISEVS